MPMRWPRPHGHEGVEGAHAEADLRGRSRARLSGGGRGVLDRDLRQVGRATGRRRSGGRGRRARGRAARRRRGSAAGRRCERTCVAGAEPGGGAERQADEAGRAAGGDLGEHRRRAAPSDLDEVADGGVDAA